jgi:hypothetical protein
MASLRGRIISIAARDIDGNFITNSNGNSMPVETVTLVLSVDYVDGDLRQLLNASLAVAPHEQHQRELVRMHDQRAERAPGRGALLEPGDAAPTGASSDGLAEQTAARFGKLEIDHD